MATARVAAVFGSVSRAVNDHVTRLHKAYYGRKEGQ